MIDRHRSLIHILMAGLVGLTLGLFVGWWVWPVQWIEAPGAAPAVSAPAQTVEGPAVGSERSDSNYSAVLNWVSQGLLYVAAALLLVGGVVIGYQLLRQSQGKDPPEQPFPLPFNRNRSNQATAPREGRAKPPTLAGRPARQRQPGLGWLRRESETERQTTSEEPVFREQSIAAPRPDERTRHSPTADSEYSRRGIERSQVELAPTQLDEDPSPEGTTGHLAGAYVAPPEQAVEGERGPDGPLSLDGPETATRGMQESDDEADYERFAEGIDRDLSPVESSTDKDIQELGGGLPAGAMPTEPEIEGHRGSQDSEDQDRREEDWQAMPSGAPPAEVPDEVEEESVSSRERHELSEPAAGPDGPYEREGRGPEASLMQGPESESVETRLTQPEAAPIGRTTRQLVGQFEANYAFGIQTYDESFTINGADGELLGACGVGINESVDRAAANTDQVRLLDIWLYDRSAVRSVSQPLVSPGFDESGLVSYTEGNGSESSLPLEVFPGLTCTLQSDGIILECTVKNASFLEGEQAPMPFRSVSVSLAVYVQS
ncbi:MAG: hypothetical protein OXK78_05205 [Caldilineaceae bacterium]|nr:hypothetical protein [Caldilineaceae bacterium]